jgi:c-di-GMP-binding flagellar brake protein YcgR
MEYATLYMLFDMASSVLQRRRRRRTKRISAFSCYSYSSSAALRKPPPLPFASLHLNILPLTLLLD